MESDLEEPVKVADPRRHGVQQPRFSKALMRLIREKNQADLKGSHNALERLGGSLAVHCSVDLDEKKVVEAASMATLFRGYEAMLPGRNLDQAGRVSATASGICGGVHATASALCLEMALGISPPPLGIVLRNLLLSCQYLNDNCMHIFVLAGPDYSQQVVESTNPEIWQKAKHSHCRFAATHGFHTISDIMTALNKVNGSLYKEALHMVSLARKAYTLLGGKYPHSESIVPGGVSLNVTAATLTEFKALIQPFADYSQRTAVLWDDLFNFMLNADPRYEQLGKSTANLLDFGQWDHPQYYDGRYQSCDNWGPKRWSTPAVVINGKLTCTRLSKLNAALEEHLDYSFQTRAIIDPKTQLQYDPNANPISALHPWNKVTQPPKAFEPHAYSWGSSFTWRGHNFEVGAYSRLYLTAMAQQIPASRYLNATGKALEFLLPQQNHGDATLKWTIPSSWNTFERNRARAYALAFSFAVTQENIDIADQLLRSNETQTQAPFHSDLTGQHLGVGLWGASRGFLAHWAIIKDQHIDNYQIAIPSRVNIGTCTPSQEPGPLEKALINTPVLESKFSSTENFCAIDIQRTIQSFDPCMSCSAHILTNRSNKVLNKVIDTCFPI